MAVPNKHIFGKSYRVASPKIDSLSNNSKPIKKKSRLKQLDNWFMTYITTFSIKCALLC